MRTKSLWLIPLFAGLQACAVDPTEPDPGTPAETGITFAGSLASGCPAPRPATVLIDPTHDGGTWWFPQAASTPAGFKSDLPHQGKTLADYLRARGFKVTELGRGGTMSPDSMMTFAVIIRAGFYADELRPGYAQQDLDVYEAYTHCPRTLIVLSEYLRPGRRDGLADFLGFPLEGQLTGDITDFATHPITEGVVKIPYIAGSFLTDESNPAVQVLGRLQTKAVMGLLTGREAKVFFIGDVNGIEQVPQPFVDRLLAWGF